MDHLPVDVDEAWVRNAKHLISYAEVERELLQRLVIDLLSRLRRVLVGVIDVFDAGQAVRLEHLQDRSLCLFVHSEVSEDVSHLFVSFDVDFYGLRTYIKHYLQENIELLL